MTLVSNKALTKKITAPLTYNPGKGRPKEHLAYLNYQEMQALKRLNGNNMEMGPRGLPSFPPADAIGSSSKTPTKSSGPGGGSLNAPVRTAPSSGGGSSSVSRISGGTAGSNMGSYRSSTGGSSSVSRISGGTAGSNMGSYKSSSPGMGSYKSSDSGMRAPAASAAAARNNMGAARASTQGAAPRSISGIGSPADRAIKQAVESKNARDATRTPALKEDRSKTIGVGPMGMPVGLGGQTGGRIVGAIQAVRDLGVAGVPGGPARVGVPAATMTLSTSPSEARRIMGDIAPAASPYKNVAQAERAITAEAVKTFNQKYGTNYTAKQLETMAATVAGEQAALRRDLERAGIANTIINRIILNRFDPEKYGYFGGDYKNLMRAYDAYRMRNEPFMAAKPGTDLYRRGITGIYQAMNPESGFSKTASKRVLEATHYYNPDVLRRDPDWSKGRNFERLGSHLFGTAEKPAERDIGPARAALGEGSVVVPAGGPPIPKLKPEELRRYPVPGLLSESYVRGEATEDPGELSSRYVKNLNNLVRGINETKRLEAEQTPKRTPSEKITDRIPEERPYRPYDIRVTSPPASGYTRLYDAIPEGQASPFRDALLPISTQRPGMTFNPELDRMIGEKEIYDRILPSDSTPPYDPLSGIRTPGVTAPAPERVFDPIGDLERKIAMIEGYKDYRSPPGVPGVQYPRISEDPTMPGRTVTPSFEQSLYRGQLPAGMSFTPDIPGAQYPRISEDPTMPGRTVVPSPQQSLYTGIKAIPTQGTITGPWPGQNVYEPERIIKIEDVPLDVSPEYDVLSGIRVPEQAAQTERSAVVEELGGTKIIVDGKNSTISEQLDNYELSEKDRATVAVRLAEAAKKKGGKLSDQEVMGIILDAATDGSDSSDVETDAGVEPPAETEVVEEDNVPSRSVSPITDDIGDVQFPEKKIPQRVAEMLPDLIGPSVRLADWLERRNWEKLSPSERRDLLDRWAAENAAYIRSSGADREGGGGIRDIVMGPTEYAQAPTTPTTPSEPNPEKSGPRPEIYYMWDLGIRIPSPGDPNYTQYQKYLIDTAAAQKAMGWA